MSGWWKHHPLMLSRAGLDRLTEPKLKLNAVVYVVPYAKE